MTSALKMVYPASGRYVGLPEKTQIDETVAGVDAPCSSVWFVGNPEVKVGSVGADQYRDTVGFASPIQPRHPDR